MQDDVAEGRYGASQMHDIYRGSYLTIAAADAHDSSGGCFFENDNKIVKTDPAILRVQGREGRPFLVQIRHGDTRRSTNQTPLNARGSFPFPRVFFLGDFSL